jgi:hypothetical protein
MKRRGMERKKCERRERGNDVRKKEGRKEAMGVV